MNDIKLISLAAVATCGKDLFFNISNNILKKNGYFGIRLAFADEVKKDLDPFLKEKVGISAFTTDPDEKKLIRPFIVSYSTNLMRKINPNVWINKLDRTIEVLVTDRECYHSETDILFITDTRFVNEVQFSHNVGGQVIHIKKYTDDTSIANFTSKKYTPPANEEEAYNDPLVENLSDIKVEWKQVGGNSYNDLLTNEYLNKIVLDTLNKTKYFNSSRNPLVI